MHILDTFRQDFNTACSLLLFLYSEAKDLTRVETRAYRIVRIGVVVVVGLLCLLIQCNTSNSLTLTAFTHLLIFDLLSVLVALVSLWTKRRKSCPNSYNLGYDRFEVVAVFAASMFAILLSFFEIKEALVRILEPEQVFPNYIILPCILAFIMHLLVVYGIDNLAFNHVFQACSSSWLQEHTTDMSQTLCRIIPGLSRLLLPRVNPIALIGAATVLTDIFVYILMTNRFEYSSNLTFPDPLPDTVGGIFISAMLFGTMVPMTIYCGRILLQTTPTHLIGPLDKALREASTVDGVLELQNEHFWSIGFQDMAGSLYVRVRRDANEQLVLAHVTNRLSNLVKYLTVQVYKDDWTRGSNAHSANWSVPNNLLARHVLPETGIINTTATHPMKAINQENKIN